MVERSVSVALSARVESFVAGMRTAKAQVSDFTRELEKSEKKKQALTTLGTAAGAVGAAAAIGLGAAIKASADFDKAMSGVEAATHGSAKSMDALRSAALKAGEDTAFSATEAAGGIEALSKAGVSTNDVLRGGLSGALDLAAAGGMEVSDAAEAAATAMTQFGLKGADVPHVADLLAAAAGKAQGEVSDFSAALNQSGLVANQTGLSIEETTGALGAFASQGLLGSDAGTSLKTMLQSLTPSSVKAADAMEEYGISAYDAQGNFVGLTEWAGRLQRGLGDMSDEQRNATLKTVFGSDAVRAASVIYEQGAGGIGKWINKVNDSGFAAETAATKLDNLYGDLDALKGSLETALIGTGEGAQGPLRGMVQSLTKLINAYNGLPGPVKDATAAVAALVALTGGAAFLGSRFLGAIAEGRTALTDLGWSAKRTTGLLRAVGPGLTLTAALVAANLLDDKLDDLLNTEVEGSGAAKAIEQLGRSGQVTGTLLDTFGKDLGGFASHLDVLTDSAAQTQQKMLGWAPFEINNTPWEDAKANIDKLDVAIASLVKSGNVDTAKTAFQALARAAAQKGVKIEEVLGYLPKYRAALGQVGEETRNASGATNKNTTAAERNAAAVDRQVTKLNDLVEAQREAALEAVQSQRDRLALNETLKATRQEIAQGTKTLKWNTKAGDENRTALLDLADQWNNSTGKVQDAKGAYGDMRKEFIRLAKQAGATDKQAERLADQLLAVPPNTKSEIELPGINRVMDELADLRGEIKTMPNGNPKVNLDTADARREMAEWARDMAGKLKGIENEEVRIELATSAASILHSAETMLGQTGLFNFGGKKAQGGPIRGPGGPKDDKIVSLLSDGEYVFSAERVRKAGGFGFMRAMERAIDRGETGDPPAFALGGPVSVQPRVDSTGTAQALAPISALAAGIAAGVGDQLSGKLNKALEFGGNGQPLGPGGSLSPGQLVMGQHFAQAQVGKPYIWAGAGPEGYDCSGAVAAVYNAALGIANPYFRRGGTGDMPWSPTGPGAFSYGWFTGNPGHTAGNVGGLPFESAGGVGFRTGGSATGVTTFPNIAHFDQGGALRPGWTLAHNGTGRDEYVTRFRGAGASSSAARRPQVMDARMRITNWQQGWAQVRLEMQDSIDADREFGATVGRMRA